MNRQTIYLFVFTTITIFYINKINSQLLFGKKQHQQQLYLQKDQKNAIYLYEKASKNLRLRSVLNINNEISKNKQLTISSTTPSAKTNKIYWSFKRLFTLPKSLNYIQNELSLTETMISLDNEVQDNLKEKFIISQTKNSEFDLIINNLTYADSGIYKCNLWNQKTIYYHLIVSSPILRPDLLVEKQTKKSLLDSNLIDSNKMIYETSNVSLKCLSKFSYPYPSFIWYQNNKEIIDDASSFTITTKLVDKETNTIESNLNILNINSSFHMTNFTCKLMQTEEEEKQINGNDNQEKLYQSSETVSLLIAFKPIVSIDLYLNGETNLKNYSIANHNNRLLLSSSSLLNNNKLVLFDDSDIEFECKYKSNPQDLIGITWKLDDQIQTDFNNKNKFKWLKRTNRLDLNKKSTNLSCVVTNSLGNGHFTQEINIIYAPKINLEKRVYDFDEFSSLKINCSVDASPQPNMIEWRKTDSTNNQENFKVVSSGPILEFRSIKHNEHAGNYVCIAQNIMNDSFGQSKIGQNSVRIELNVRFRPQINMVSKKMAANITLGKHTLTCMTMSNPEPSIDWYKNGLKLNANNSKYISNNVRVKSKNLYEQSLVINDLTMEDLNKVYECEAKNQLGTNRLEIELVPLSKPEKPYELRTLFVNFMMITLAWSSGFDGGLEQDFYIQINDTIVDFRNESILKFDKMQIIKSGPSLVNITHLNPETVYSIRIMSKNELGSSGWSDFIHVRTHNIDNKDSILLPQFDTLFLNVPKNRLEFTLKKDEKENENDPFIRSIIPICFNVSILMNDPQLVRAGQSYSLEPLSFKNCLEIRDKNSNEFLFENLSEDDTILSDEQTKFKSSKIKSIKVSICYQINPSICNLMPTTGIIDTYNKMSPLNHLISTSSLNHSSFSSKSNKTIPIALIIGICVCILSLLVLLFVSVIYCIRKRNFKICKSLLSHSDAVNSLKNSSSSGGSDSNDSSKTNTTSRNSQDSTDLSAKVNAIKTEFERKLAQQQNAKNFNIDIASISAPVAYKTITSSTNDIINSQNMLLCASNLSQQTSSTHVNTTIGKRTFTAALTATANNIIGKQRIINSTNNEIQVTEDEDMKKYDSSSNNPSSSSASSTTSSTAVSHNQHFFDPYNSSFNNNNPNNNNNNNNCNDLANHQLIQHDLATNSSSAGSNTDPIAINNSISSTHSITNTDSPTYNYNVTSATLNNQHNSILNNNHDSILYIKSTNYSIDESLSSQTNYTKNPIKSKNNSNLYNNNNNIKQTDQIESGYSTPSRHKKVVYEVIV